MSKAQLTQAVDIVLQAENVPLGTTIDVTVLNETEPLSTATSSALAGSLASSTASVTMTVPAGFSRIFAHATW